MSTSSKIRITFSDGVEREFSAAPGQNILEAALNDEVPVLHQCRSGSCSSCLAKLVEGEADTLAGASSTLIPSEKAQGLRLLCVTEARTDCAFQLGYDSAVGTNRATDAKAFVNAIERVADDVVRLELELAEGCWFEFRPGQFIQIKVPGTDAVRSYSMASTPTELPRIELLIRLLPEGVMSTWLLERARVDDVIDISGPYGQFFLKDAEKAPHIMIAGGTGLAPMMSMIDAIRGRSGRKPRMLLSFGCQTQAGLFHLDAIELRRQWLPHLDVRLSVDRGPAPAGVRVGNPVEAVGADAPLDPASIAYLCGPPAMIDAARRHLEERGLAPENIFAEQFVASE